MLTKSTKPSTKAKLKKYGDFLICCYPYLVDDELAPFWRYGYRIYLIRPEYLDFTEDLRLQNCFRNILQTEIGFITEEASFLDAQKCIDP